MGKRMTLLEEIAFLSGIVSDLEKDKKPKEDSKQTKHAINTARNNLTFGKRNEVKPGTSESFKLPLKISSNPNTTTTNSSVRSTSFANPFKLTRIQPSSSTNKALEKEAPSKRTQLLPPEPLISKGKFKLVKKGPQSPLRVPTTKQSESPLKKHQSSFPVRPGNLVKINYVQTASSIKQVQIPSSSTLKPSPPSKVCQRRRSLVVKSKYKLEVRKSPKSAKLGRTPRPRTSNYSIRRNHFPPKNPFSSQYLSQASYTINQIRKAQHHKKTKLNSTRQVVNIHGVKYEAKKSGKSLKRLRMSSFSLGQDKSFTSTYPQSQSVKIANRVLQRSKAILKYKFNNYCVFYNRFGTCKNRDRGKCRYIHDPKQVTICSRYIELEKCERKGCKLSHNLKIGKMPACRTYNESGGHCSRDNCPFPHVRTPQIKRSEGKSTKVKPRLKIRDISSVKSRKEKAEPEEKARYYDPEDTPARIIPMEVKRRLPAHPYLHPEEVGLDSRESYKSESGESSDKSECIEVKSEPFPSTSLVHPTPVPKESMEERRERLLSKLSKIKNRFQLQEQQGRKSLSNFDDFIPFRKD